MKKNLKSNRPKRYERCAIKREQKEITEDGLSYQEIGAILGISANEVKTIEASALKKLRVPNQINKKLKEYAGI